MNTYGHKVLEDVPNLRDNLRMYTVTGAERVRPSLLWEYDLTSFDWQAMRAIVVQRVCERGLLTDFYGILRLYGYKAIQEIIRNEIKCFYNSIDLEFTCFLFNIEITETHAYKHTEERHKKLDLP